MIKSITNDITKTILVLIYLVAIIFITALELLKEAMCYKDFKSTFSLRKE